MLARRHATKEYLPKTGVVIDVTVPIERVVDEALGKCVQVARARAQGHEGKSHRAGK